MKISVIIPTLNEEAWLPRTLAQFERLPGTWEVLVVDSGSIDRTLDIAHDAGASVVANAPRGRGNAMNLGATRASGEILLFLHADTLLPIDAFDLITSTLRHPDVAATGFRLGVDRDEWRYRMLSPIGTLRFRVQRTFFGDQGIAVRRRDFERVDGYHEPVLMEDVDLSRRLRSNGRLVLLPASVTTSARRFQESGVVRTLLLMSLFQVAYAAGLSAERIHRWYGDVRVNDGAATDSLEQINMDDLVLIDEDGKPTRLVESTQHGPTILVFLRWLG